MLSEPGTGELVQRAWRIEVIKGPDRGASVEREMGTLVIGTQADADLVLTDSSVSRRHATLELRPEGVLVIDCDSTNGTRVAGARVDRALVTAGGVISVGRTQVRVLARDTQLQVEANQAAGFPGFLTAEVELQKSLARLRLVARTDVAVMIQGEQGTGRRMLARLLHEGSNRASGPLVIIACDALEASEVEARLLGDPARGIAGAMADARGGTLVLAGVERLPRSMQAKLLEILEHRHVSQNGPIDVRFIFTCGDDVDHLVKSGEFREDLYYRVAVVRARVPPLRSRPADLELLARYFVNQVSGGRAELSPESMRVLADYDWPANVRELATVIERAVTLGTGGVIMPGDLLPEVTAATPRAFHEAKDAVIAEFERRYVRALLARHDNNISHASRDAGLSRGAFYALMRRSGIEI